MRVEIGYTYTKGGGFTLGRVFTTVTLQVH